LVGLGWRLDCKKLPLAQKTQKYANTTDDMSAVIARGTRASAAHSVLVERRDAVIIHRFERYVFELEPDPKVRNRAKMSTHHMAVIPGLY
jgi:hypothetical protein